MGFTKKDILSVKNEMENAINSVFSSTGITSYPSKLKSLINLLQNNRVLNVLTTPYFKANINFKDIEIERGDNQLELVLPEDTNKKIAFVLQKLKAIIESNNSDEIYDYTYNIYSHRSYVENIYKWNMEILKPSLDEILNSIDRLIKTDSKEKVYIDIRVSSIVNKNNVYINNSSNVAI
ncbi:hypothetical protein CPJCM30710_01770 [Clostridium polyendosporum]|uniref:Uncharacterized protein n=1 Tax=Clostridium polyendosporum TaxID=69208 RepID=A0A919VFH6_9CLOT|nr:hypothetical protein [Clostridium polyendosporum]GIM27511.1 hypothetical protein CPJCM30710_01770 [Clostridium polyendosporum]